MTKPWCWRGLARVAGWTDEYRGMAGSFAPGGGGHRARLRPAVAWQGLRLLPGADGLACRRTEQAGTVGEAQGRPSASGFGAAERVR